MRLHAFAKINLDLRILGKRPDGYHELRTVFQTIDWSDLIDIDWAKDFEFSASHGPADDTNLVVRAVRAFEKATGVRVEAQIHLTKEIPAGAGLGGGSADAAVTFLGLQSLYGVSVPLPDLARTLRSVGSDVPFFVHGGRALGTGRGDEITELDDGPDYWLVLVLPEVSVSTAEAYSWLTVQDRSNNIEGFRAGFVSAQGIAVTKNDFEAPVFRRHPELKEIRDELVRVGAFNAAMSGSGSVVFGQFACEEDAVRAASNLAPKHSVRVTRPLSRSEYFSRMVES
jgi:4-diphosphocytidyl-2-C-methyl-D-erythritol kinase